LRTGYRKTKEKRKRVGERIKDTTSVRYSTVQVRDSKTHPTAPHPPSTVSVSPSSQSRQTQFNTSLISIYVLVHIFTKSQLQHPSGVSIKTRSVNRQPAIGSLTSWSIPLLYQGTPLCRFLIATFNPINNFGPDHVHSSKVSPLTAAISGSNGSSALGLFTFSRMTESTVTRIKQCSTKVPHCAAHL
jgi:hypothetical protein